MSLKYGIERKENSSGNRKIDKSTTVINVQGHKMVEKNSTMIVFSRILKTWKANSIKSRKVSVKVAMLKFKKFFNLND